MYELPWDRAGFLCVMFLTVVLGLNSGSDFYGGG